MNKRIRERKNERESKMRLRFFLSDLGIAILLILVISVALVVGFWPEFSKWVAGCLSHLDIVEAMGKLHLP